MLIDTIKVGDHGSGADVHVIAHVGITDVAEMAGFHAFTQRALFYFNKVADVRS